MELLKVDSETKEALTDIEFKVSILDGLMKSQIWELKSNDKGIVSLKGLEYGNYYFNKIKAPDHYEINQDLSFVIDKDVETKTLTAENKVKTGEVDFTKTDVTNGQNIEGAKIKIECLSSLDKGKVIEFISSKN